MTRMLLLQESLLLLYQDVVVVVVVVAHQRVKNKPKKTVQVQTYNLRTRARK